uniref:USP domain-containing protein n=1 Tax=Globodera pallida TaxID=36090 RepID=A0A183CFP6_GLOPA
MQQSNFDVSEQQHSNAASPSRNEPENAEFFTRLHLFERPTERPRRGTFLLPKEDLFTADCALWRIDNQNLLQKYLPVVLDGTCSSCDQDVQSAIQLFSLEEQYDYETLSSITASGSGAISPSNLATDFYVCAQCELYALSYHKAYHLCFYVLKNAEEKLEQVSAKYADLSADELIGKCLEDKIWLNKIADIVMCVSKDGIKDKKLFPKELPID